MPEFNEGDWVVVPKKFKSKLIHFADCMAAFGGKKAKVVSADVEAVEVRFPSSAGGSWYYPPASLKKLEIKKPKHPKFKGGDRVKIARKLGGRRTYWVEPMDQYVGATGRVIKVLGPPMVPGFARLIRVKVGHSEWNYPINSLEKIK